MINKNLIIYYSGVARQAKSRLNIRNVDTDKMAIQHAFCKCHGKYASVHFMHVIINSILT